MVCLMPNAIQKRSKEYLLHLFNIKVSKCGTYVSYKFETVELLFL